MKDFRFFNEAKKAKDSAAAKANELAEQVSGTAEELKAMAVDVKNQIADQAAGMGEVGLAKLNEMITDFNAALPLLREAGYVVKGVDIQIGVPPRIVANFSGGAGVPEEKIETLLADNAERKLTVLLVKSVHEATKLQSKLDIKGMRPSGVSVQIGLIPRVVVKFGPATAGPRERAA